MGWIRKCIGMWLNKKGIENGFNIKNEMEIILF